MTFVTLRKNSRPVIMPNSFYKTVIYKQVSNEILIGLFKKYRHTIFNVFNPIPWLHFYMTQMVFSIILFPKPLAVIKTPVLNLNRLFMICKKILFTVTILFTVKSWVFICISAWVVPPLTSLPTHNCDRSSAQLCMMKCLVW